VKQFQFEVKNLNYLRRELARIKRFCSYEDYSSVYFQIFTQLSDYKELREITRVIESDFPKANYYGFQTYGNIVEGKLGQQKTMVLCSVYELESTKTKLVYIDSSKRNADFKSLDDLWKYVNKETWIKAVELTTSLKNSKKNLNGGELPNLREDVQIFGGISCNSKVIADDNTYIFTKNYGKSDKGICAVLLGGEDLHVSCGYIRGWEGLGKSFTITKTNEDSILEINNKPAFDIYRKYLHIEQDESFTQNGPMFPLLVEQNGIECIRIPFPSENKDEIYFGRHFEEGLKARLSYGDKPTIMGNVRRKVPDIAAYSPESIRIYSCAIRRLFWTDEKISSETELFDSIAPTSGCYTHGEIIRIGNYLNQLNATMVYALIREGKAYKLDYSIDEVLENIEEENGLAPKLIHYVGAVTGELEGQFNKTLLGLAGIYKSMFLINLEKQTIVQLDDGQEARRLLSEKDGFSEKMNYFLNKVISPDTVPIILDFCNFDTLVQRIKNNNFIDCEVKGKTIGWCRAQFIVINRDEKGVPFEFVFTTQGIDAQKKERDEQQKIIQTLADTYHTLHLFDLKTNTCSEVSSDGLIHEMYVKYKELGTQEQLNLILTKMVNEEFLNNVMEFTNLQTLEKRLAGKKMISLDFLGNINGWVKGSFINYEQDKNGKLEKVLFATQVIDDVKRREERLMRNSKTDGLTELSNRRAFEEELVELEKDYKKKNIIFFSLDVNGLKDVNDDFGHDAGDELIVGAANCMKICFGSYGSVYRTGGDEFAAILDAGKTTAEKVVDQLERTIKIWQGKLVKSLSISYGYVLSTEKNVKSLQNMLKLADKRMYEMKDAYYRINKGVDRRKQRGAFEMILESFVKILRVNLTRDSFEIIKVNEIEEILANKITFSECIKAFIESDLIYPEDIPLFQENIQLEKIVSFFKKEKQAFHVVYRRKVDDVFRKVVLEIVPTKEFKPDNMDVFLYVKDITF